MIDRIDLFMPPRSLYQVLHYFTKNLSDALTRCGVRCRILEAERDKPQQFIDTLLEDPPQCTLSFNGLLPDEEGRFFCDLIRIPHVACLVDAPHHFLALTKSPYSIITSVDRFGCEFFQGMNFQNVLFMPHAVDKKLIQEPAKNEKRDIDVLLLASFIDYESIREKWQKELPQPIAKAMEYAAELTLKERNTPYIHALVQALDVATKQHGVDVRTLDFISLIDQLEDYINGKDRVELVKAITDAKIKIYGAGSHKWESELKNKSNVTLHEPIDYLEALQLMRRSKIVLNSCPSIRGGAHERIFAGIASGAAVVTNETLYMMENFKQNKDILFYQYTKRDSINSLINEYLSDESKRQALVHASQETVKKGHTWDHRAADLLNKLEPILPNI